MAAFLPRHVPGLNIPCPVDAGKARKVKVLSHRSCHTMHDDGH